MKRLTPNIPLPSPRRLLLLASLLVPALAQSQAITLTNSDALGNSSFNTAGFWDSGAAPLAGSDYVTSTNQLRTPADAANYFFAGNSLTLQTPATVSLLLKGLTNNIYAFNTLTNNNGTIQTAGASTQTYSLFGNTILATNTTLTVNAANGPINLSGPMSGSGSLAVASASGYVTTLGASNSYSGSTTVSSGTLKAGAGPVLYLSFDNVSGTNVINGGSGGAAMNGALYGTASISSSGRYGNALSIGSTLNASSVRIPSSVVLFSSNANWTIGMWLKTTVSGAVYAYQGAGGWASGNTIFHLSNGSTDTSAGTRAGGVSYARGFVEGTAVLNDGNWHFVVTACNGAGLTQYVDGNVDAFIQNQWTGASVGTQFWLGACGETGDGVTALNGLIDEVYVYNRALSQAEVQALMTVTNASAAGLTGQLSPYSPVTVNTGATMDLNISPQTIGGLNGGGTVLNSQAFGTATLTISNTSSAGFTGSITNTVGTLALVKNGSATQILGGNNGYSGSTTVSGGILAFTNSNTITNSVAVAGGTLVVTNSGTLNLGGADTLAVGNVSGKPGAVYQSAGTTVTVTNVALGAFAIGTTAGAYGYYNLSGGTLNLDGEVDVAGSGGGAGTFGQFDMSNGTINLTNSGSTYFLGNRGAVGESSVINLSGGTVQIVGGGTPADGAFNGLTISWAAGSQTNVTTISGTAQFLTPSLTVKLNEGASFNAAGNAGNITTLNLNGGTLQTIGFRNGVASANPNVNLNFNGGTLLAGTAGSTTFLTNLGGAYVYSGGAFINDNGQAISIGQTLQTPVGNGVSAIAVATGGAGYITPPQVFISGGGGSNATAFATVSGGSLTGITVTGPGNGYSSAPNVVLAGGGATAAATIGTVSLAANVSGGLTKSGSGTLTLTKANTYTGNTTVTAGTLALSGSGALASGNTVVSNSATLDVSGVTGGFTLGGSQSLLGSGSINGAVATVSGSKIYAGTDGGYGTNTFNTSLNIVSGAYGYFDLGSTYSGANDQIVVNGALTINGAIHLNAPSSSANLDTTADYVLITASGGITGTVSSTPVWGVAPLNWKNFTVITVGNNIQLHYTATTPPIAVAAANPATVTRNQSTLISVTVTPGSGSINPSTGVTLDASPLGLSATVPMILSGTANVYTNTIIIPAGVSIGGYTLNATITDSTPLTGSAGAALTVVAAAQTWAGGGTDANWSTNPNWLNSTGPGLAGDSVIFAGSAGLTSTMNTNYTLTGLTFSNTAGSFTIGNSTGNTLTLAGGGLTNNSASAQTLNVPVVLGASQTFNLAAGDLTVNGNLSGTGNLTLTGGGNLNLTGTDTHAGLITLLAGALNVTGSASVGTTAQNIEIAPYAGETATLNVTNGTLNALRLILGGISGNSTTAGTAIVNQSGGTVNSAQWLTVGSGGSAVGNAGGAGVYNLSGGTVNVESQQLEVANFTNATGQVNLSGSATLNLWANANISLGANAYAANGTFVQNGGSVNFYSDAGVTLGGSGALYLGRSTALSSNYTYNLNGGTLTVPAITSFGGTSQFYFNGGSLVAAAASPFLMSGLTSAYVSTNGALINDGGYAISIDQGLLHDPALGSAADGGLVKSGSSTLTLGGSSTYTGNTVISGGTLQLSEPVLHLTFDKVSGTTVSNQGSGGSAMDGTLTGTASIVSGGRFGNALSIPSGASSNAYVLVNSPVVNFNNTGNWTWGMWIQTTTAGGTYMYQGNGTAWASGYTTFYLNNGAAAAGTHAGGVRYAQGWETGTNVVNDGTWHFVVMTDNGGVKKMYVDGVLDSLTFNAWSGNGVGSQLRIGGNGPGEADGQVGLNGLIDEVYVYNRALSQAEVQSLYGNNNSQVLPTTTAVTLSGGTLDVGGLAQTIGTLTGSGNVMLDDISGSPGILTLGNASNFTFPGTIADTSGAGALTKIGTGTLTLSGSSTYAGLTTVSNGTVLVDGTVTGPAYVAAGGVLGGIGSVDGAVTVAGNLSPGDTGTTGALTLYNTATFATGATATFTLSDSFSGANDQVTIYGALTNNNNVIHIKALGTGHSLDTTGDYVLVNFYSGITGGFLSTPVWDVRPVNYANFTVVTIGSQVLLHYTATTPPTAGITATPSTVSRNQATLISVTATPGSSPISTVTVDASALGGSATQPLYLSTGNVYTNTIAATAGTSPGSYSLLATVTDTGSQSATAGTSLLVTIANDVWTGIGSDNYFDTNPNWSHTASPGFTGDSLVFAGSTQLNPSMDNNYSVTGVTFSNNASSFTVSTANSSTLTLTGGGVVNNSANLQTVDVPVTFAAPQTLSATAGNLVLDQAIDNGGYLLTGNAASGKTTTVSGSITGTGGVTVSGAGTLTLGGVNTYTGADTVSSGTLNIASTGSVTSTSITVVGSAAGNAVLVNSGSLSQPDLFVGNANGANGAVYQTGGTLSVTGGAAGDLLDIGNIAGGYGYYNASGGTVTANGIAIGGENNIGTGFTGTGGNGVMDITGGTVNDTGWMVLARGATNETGILNVYNGLLTYAGGGLVCNWGIYQTSVISVMGGMVSNTAAVGIGLGSGGNTGILNLNGGLVQASVVGGNFGGTYGQVNFNGGTLQASANSANYLPVNGADIFSGGATLNNGGHTVTIGQALLAPTGYGVSSIAVSSGGTGYIGTPIVSLNGGAGSGATASAQINAASGAVTNLLVTCPGTGYLITDVLTVTFQGGGGTGATAGTPVLATNASGGLTSTGNGTLTLTAASTYTGNTVIAGGTLALGAGGSVSNSTHLNVASGATLNVTAAGLVVGGSQTLQGTGTVTGNVTNTGTILPGAAGTIGTLTFNNNLNLSAGGKASFTLNQSLGTSSEVISAGVVTYGGTLAVTNVAGTLTNGATFTLFSAGTATGNFASIAGTPGTGLAYSFNPTNGVLSVVAGMASNPTNITASVSGTALTLSWPADHLGWILQAQTNSLTTGLTGNWADVGGSAASTTNNIIIDPAQGTVFYRLRHP